MKKIIKSLLLLATATTGTMGLVSCSDDDNLPAADALFRPVITESGNIEHFLDDNLKPYMTIKWDNYTDANQYIVKIESADRSDVREVTLDTIACKFDNLQYDNEYTIYLTASNTNTGLKSKPFTLTTTSLDYPTKMKTPATTDLIDTQARIKWSGASYDSLQIWKDSNDSLVATVILTEGNNADGEIIVRNLNPKTTYRALAFANDQYLGKKRFTTTAAEKYEGVVIDLRGMEEGSTYITATQLAADVEANPDQDITYVLEGGTIYKISGGTNIPGTSKTIKFVTGLTLSGNAIFRSGGGLGGVAQQDIYGITFEKIDFISDKAIQGGGYEVETNHDKGWGGRQVFNINGYAATISNLTFKSCSMTGYRAVIRSQKDNDNITNIVLEDCAINAIGDQGVLTTTNKKGDWRNVTMKNCTINNIVMLCDFRSSVDKINFTIENCTFCYAPIETTANANTPMFRLGTNNVLLKVKNTLFGPSMKTKDSSGDEIYPYEAGTAGSIFLSGTPDNIDVENSYKTNFSWTDLGAEESKIYPLEGLTELGISETELWDNPANGKFNIIGKVQNVDFTKLGDSRWQ